MSDLIGSGSPAVNFTLNNGQATRVWWYGYGVQGVGSHIGFPYCPSIATVFSRVVTSNNAMEYSEGAGSFGIVYTTDVRAEPGSSGASMGVFRLLVGVVQ